MIDNIESKEKSGAERGCDAVVGWRFEAEEIDTLGGLRANNATIGGNWENKEGWNGRHG